jgi:hypothetical protein
MLMAIFFLSMPVRMADIKERTIKVETSRPILLVLQMKPIGGKLIVDTGNRRDELTISFPSESQAVLTQTENTIAIRGQHQPSTYVVRIPQGSIKLEIEVNGKKYVINQGAGSENHYEFKIS